jgi:hypothetical protein
MVCSGAQPALCGTENKSSHVNSLVDAEFPDTKSSCFRLPDLRNTFASLVSE